MQDHDLIRELKDQSTWLLLGLGIITYGIYFAHYIKKQTTRINNRLEQDVAISSGFVISILAMSYLSAALSILYLIVDYGHPIEAISNITDFIWSIMLIVWGFKARNRVNSLCSFNSESENWFHGLWTFLFTPLYFNYKVNKLNEKSAEQVAPVDL